MKFSAEKKESFRNPSRGEESEASRQPRIAVVGCGGAGNRILNNLYDMGFKGATTICVTCYESVLNEVRADKKILFKRMPKRGICGGMPKENAELARAPLLEVLKDFDLVFFTAGLGGYVGNFVSPVVAEIAKEYGALVIGIVTTPLRVEGRDRAFRAEEALESLRCSANTLIILDHSMFFEYLRTVSPDIFYSIMNKLISETIKGIIESITVSDTTKIEFADFRKIMYNGGISVLLVGESKSQAEITEIVQKTFNYPSLSVDYKDAAVILIQIICGPEFSLKKAEEIASMLTCNLPSSAHTIWTLRKREDLKARVRVIVLITGVQSAQSFDSINYYKS